MTADCDMRGPWRRSRREAPDLALAPEELRIARARARHLRVLRDMLDRLDGRIEDRGPSPRHIREADALAFAIAELEQE